MRANPQIISQFVNFNERLSIPFFQRGYELANFTIGIW